jgi:hypothetical protein
MRQIVRTRDEKVYCILRKVLHNGSAMIKPTKDINISLSRILKNNNIITSTKKGERLYLSKKNSFDIFKI